MKRYIFSGDYVANELCAEFGRIPPAFLPVGGVRLFEHQLSEQDNVLILPSCFSLPGVDSERLNELGVHILRIDSCLSVIEALKTVLGGVREKFEMLMGDSLIQHNFSDELNMIGISKVSDDNRWDFFDVQNYPNFVFNGYIKCLDYSYFDEILQSSNSIRVLLDSLTTNDKFRPLKVESWFDFGHVTTFFHSKRQFLTARKFNDIRFENDMIVKTSNNQLKIQAELNWYEKLPIEYRNLCPAYLGSDFSNTKLRYKLEYCPYSTLAELYVFGDLRTSHWETIFKKIINVSSNLANFSSATTGNLESLFQKTERRIKLLDHKVFPVDYLRSLMEKVKPCLKEYKEVHSHGDLCLSNILWDFRSGRPKLIDPRGLDLEDNISTTLPIIYDLAKLSHSVHGLYDHIVFKRCRIINDTLLFDSEVKDKSIVLSNILFALIDKIYGIDKKELVAMEILLFIGMIPLHYDNTTRQKAFIFNLKRLEKEL